MKNKFLLIGLLFAVPLFFPFIAYAQSGTSTLTQFTTIDCPPIEVSGKVAFEKDCVQGILDQVHQSYNKEITSAAAAPRAGDEAKQTSELYNKCEEDRVRASDMLSSCTASRDQAKVSLQAMEAQMQELIASRDQAKVSLEEKEAQIHELTTSRDHSNEALQASQAQIQELTASRDHSNEALQASQAQIQELIPSRHQPTGGVVAQLNARVAELEGQLTATTFNAAARASRDDGRLSDSITFASNMINAMRGYHRDATSHRHFNTKCVNERQYNAYNDRGNELLEEQFSRIEQTFNRIDALRL
jgi:chromosome segregation ATPase